eukprot:TRINITY_DN9677_c0_g1_i1.p1 TRINITY_DN9677_c0_g1~~TRINITY_DN9677_c0_g1_i1.p1  ORF type:complete len:103 (-),score=13.30 TRINITY_DN9677_c0_g1_i1:30-338(-)
MASFWWLCWTPMFFVRKRCFPFGSFLGKCRAKTKSEGEIDFFAAKLFVRGKDEVVDSFKEKTFILNSFSQRGLIPMQLETQVLQPVLCVDTCLLYTSPSPRD